MPNFFITIFQDEYQLELCFLKAVIEGLFEVGCVLQPMNMGVGGASDKRD
ncbi:hypothetical protein GIV19_22015 [Pseudomonas syringae]|nr:hypothetical protein [Pseudomonas syringae]MCF5709940.1 hypothetical protein [Pseudomonas syringae]